jgi:hypothetical protein
MKLLVGLAEHFNIAYLFFCIIDYFHLVKILLQILINLVLLSSQRFGKLTCSCHTSWIYLQDLVYYNSGTYLIDASFILDRNYTTGYFNIKELWK